MKHMGPKYFDVAVLGAGPAGLIITTYLAERGLRVASVSPTLERPWPNNYGIWLDEAAALDLLDVLDETWTTPQVLFDHMQPVTLPRTYARVDNDRFFTQLRQRCDAHHVEHIDDLARELRHHVSNTDVILAEHPPLRARLVIDATGHRSNFIRRPPGRPPAAQVAYGQRIRVRDLPLAKDTMWLMDFRRIPRHDDHHATFLYAMPLQDGTLFVEETSLVNRPPVTFDTLQRRLRERLAQLNIEALELIEEEFCVIPMGLPLPDLQQPVLGFGGAAGLVHPSTGYMLPRMLGAAPDVANTLMQAFENPELSTLELAQRGWEVLWPRWRRQQYHLLTYGMETLLTYDGPLLREHFKNFFALPQHHWQPFYEGCADTRSLAQSMLTMFARAPLKLQLALAKGGARPGTLKQMLRAYL